MLRALHVVSSREETDPGRASLLRGPDVLLHLVEYEVKGGVVAGVRLELGRPDGRRTVVAVDGLPVNEFLLLIGAPDEFGTDRVVVLLSVVKGPLKVFEVPGGGHTGLVSVIGREKKTAEEDEPAKVALESPVEDGQSVGVRTVATVELLSEKEGEDVCNGLSNPFVVRPFLGRGGRRRETHLVP